jgi:squalene synthase HpnD
MDTTTDSQPLPTAEEAAAYVEAVVKRSGTSFYSAMRVLPPEKRRAMYAVYAFCREVDDIADEPGRFDDKLTRLGQWRGEIERLYGGRPRHAVTCALLGPVEHFGLRKEDFRAVIDGMEMDARDGFRIADMTELTLYCDRVACAVGRLSNRVFGLDDERSEALASCLGQALQLTNILRDIYEDAERGRLYLPADLLLSYGVRSDDLWTILKHPVVIKVCDMLSAVAENHFNEASAILAGCDRKQMRPAIMMMEVYRRILKRLQARGWDRLQEPVRLPMLDKAWVLIRHGML